VLYLGGTVIIPRTGEFKDCDVAVIGSGIAGILTACELCKRGKSVVVIDRGRIAGGMTSRTSAHLAPLCDDLVSELIKLKDWTRRSFSAKARRQP
jgi:glycine/D-amino acid oxidase-like deaminating enzyme